MLPSRTSSSSNKSSKQPPPQVIEISSSEDEHVTPLSSSRTEANSHEKRTSSKFKQTSLDVSLWNVEPRIKPSKSKNPHHLVTPRTSLSSSANQPIVSTSRQNGLSQSVSSQPTLRSSTTSRAQLPVLQSHHSSGGISDKSVKLSSSSNISYVQNPIRVRLNETASPHPAQNKILDHASQPVPSSNKDVINQINSFSYSTNGRSSDVNDKSKYSSLTTSQNTRNSIHQPIGKKYSQLSLDRLDQSNERQNRSSYLARKTLSLTSQTNHTPPSVSSIPDTTSEKTASKEVDNILRKKLGHEQLRLSSPGPSSPSLLRKSKKDASMSTPNSSNQSFNPSTQDASPVHKKRKLEIVTVSDKIVHENRFTELPNLDHQEPTASSQLEPPSKTLGSSSLSNSKPVSTPVVPCVLHPSAILPLPQLKPRARPESPDWSSVPLYRRPLQGRERPGEFSDDLQKTWILENNPDLSTSLGHLIFCEEINSNQMWENPEIPRIDVVVPDEVKKKMFEDLKSANDNRGAKTTGLDRSLAPPLEFIYTDRLVYRTDERPISPNWHCNCHGDCLNNPNCECRAHQTLKVRQIIAAMDMELSESDSNFEGFAYTSTRKPRHASIKKPDSEDPEGRCIKEMFIRGTFPVFECNSLCGCGPDCVNRTVGRGRREKLSVEKTLSRGWGVVANHPIAPGRLVTHYSGELITDKMSLERGQKKYDHIGRTYIFDLDPWWINTIYSHSFQDGLLLFCEENRKSNLVERTTSKKSGTGLNGQESHLPMTRNLSSASKRKLRNPKPETKENAEVECIYSVDAFLYGNIARFINHSCNANTCIVPVYIEDSDPTRPIFAMFANKMIKTGKEITTSYSDPNPDDDDDGNGRQNKKTQFTEPHLGRYMECKCGAPNCRGIMFA